MAEANAQRDSGWTKRDVGEMSRLCKRSSAAGDSAPGTREMDCRPDQVRQILDQALHNDADDSEAASADLAALRQVVDHCSAEEFVFDPVMVQMVKTMVERVLHVEPEKSGRMQAMYQTLAQTLWDNQLSRARVERLWIQLRGE